jgi:uncharacterized protein YqjF (DUF2071 family)
MERTFLTARWTDLVLLTYEVPVDLVRSVVHPELEPDLWEGQAHVSFVAFDFRDTRLLGVKVPGYVNFPEINLRAYVRRGEERGVSFVRELVPKRAIAWLARVGYNEPYRATPMRSGLAVDGNRVRTDHAWRWYGSEFTLTATGHGVEPPKPGGVEHHFKEHSWGYGSSRSGKLLTYRVHHPEWATRPLRECSWKVDFGMLYGPKWAFLNHQEPMSKIFAVGSEISVSMPQR